MLNLHAHAVPYPRNEDVDMEVDDNSKDDKVIGSTTVPPPMGKEENFVAPLCNHRNQLNTLSQGIHWGKLELKEVVISFLGKTTPRARFPTDPQGSLAYLAA